MTYIFILIFASKYKMELEKAITIELSSSFEKRNG